MLPVKWKTRIYWKRKVSCKRKAVDYQALRALSNFLPSWAQHPANHCTVFERCWLEDTIESFSFQKGERSFGLFGIGHFNWGHSYSLFWWSISDAVEISIHPETSFGARFTWNIFGTGRWNRSLMKWLHVCWFSALRVQTAKYHRCPCPLFLSVLPSEEIGLESFGENCVQCNKCPEAVDICAVGKWWCSVLRIGLQRRQREGRWTWEKCNPSPSSISINQFKWNRTFRPKQLRSLWYLPPGILDGSSPPIRTYLSILQTQETELASCCNTVRLQSNGKVQPQVDCHCHPMTLQLHCIWWKARWLECAQREQLWFLVSSGKWCDLCKNSDSNTALRFDTSHFVWLIFSSNYCLKYELKTMTEFDVRL